MSWRRRSRGREFESQHRTLDRHFSHYLVKFVLFALKRPKIKEKEAKMVH